VRAPAYLPAYTDRKGFWTLDGDAIRWLDVVLFAATGALRIWPVFVLGVVSADWWLFSRPQAGY